MNIKITAIFSALLLIGIASILVIVFRGEPSNTGIKVDFGFWDSVTEPKYELKKSDDNPEYKDKNNRFSFNYPKDFTVGYFGDTESGETVLVQRSGEKVGFQIFITQFDEPASGLTVERIKKEIPDLEVNNPEPVNWEGEIIGLSFTGSNSFSDQGRDIWIVKNGYLYQMTTYLSEQKLLQQVLSTWKFL